MYLFHSLGVIASIAFTALATLPPPPLPDGKYLGMAQNRKYFFTYIAGSQARGPATEKELGTLAYLAGREAEQQTRATSPLASKRKPGTVAVWQDENWNIWIASSDGTFSETGSGHGEQNIIAASGENIKGGWTIAYTWRGSKLGLRDACNLCKRAVQGRGATDLFARLGAQPEPPVLPSGWKAVWMDRTVYKYVSQYDLTSSGRMTIPTTPKEAPKLPVGWSAIWDEDSQGYYYEADDDYTPSQWEIPTRTPMPPSNQEGAEAAGWGPQDPKGKGKGSGSNIGGSCRGRRRRSQSGPTVGPRPAAPTYANGTSAYTTSTSTPPPLPATDQDMPPTPEPPVNTTQLVVIPVPILVNYTSSWPPLPTNQTKASRSPDSGNNKGRGKNLRSEWKGSRPALQSRVVVANLLARAPLDPASAPAPKPVTPEPVVPEPVDPSTDEPDEFESCEN